MEFQCRPQIKFSQKEYQLTRKFSDMCHELEDLFNSINELSDIKTASEECDIATGIEWGQFCEIVDLFQDFVHENMNKN